MSTSKGFAYGLSKFDVSRDIISMYVELMTTGYSNSHKEYYSAHTTPGAVVVVLELTLPLNGIKGAAKLLPASNQQPPITSEIKSYVMEEYLGYKFYIHPQHTKIGIAVETGKCDVSTITIGIIILKGRGCITFIPQ